MSEPRFTKGLWQWQLNTNIRQVNLLTVGRGRVYVMGFRRYGMHDAEPMFQVHEPGCDGECRGCGIMRTASEIASEPDHNGNALLDHPDAHLIAAAPGMYAYLEEAAKEFLWVARQPGMDHCAARLRTMAKSFQETLAKARGEAASPVYGAGSRSTM